MLPAWAPDHNPVEPVWSWLKFDELANFTPQGIDALGEEVIDRLVELKFDPDLLIHSPVNSVRYNGNGPSLSPCLWD